LIVIVLGLIASEHSQLVVPGSERQCVLEGALVGLFEQGLQMSGRGQEVRRKRMQARNSETYIAEVRIV